MGVRKQKIQVEVEMSTEAAVTANKKFTDSVEKSRKAVEKDNEAIKRVSTAYQVQTARAKNLAVKVAGFTKAEQRATAAAKRHQDSISRQSKAYSGLGAAVRNAAGKLRVDAVGAMQAVASMGRAAIETTIELAQESVAASNVFKNLPFSLNAARRSTKGLADDMTLARNAIMANQAGVATTGKAYGELVSVAQTLALKMGRDVNETVERVTQGIAKQEREILDELVVLPKLNDVMAEFAKANDTTVAKLTAQQRQSAFTESALQALRDATKGVTTDMGGAAGAIAKTVIQLKNAKNQLLGGKEQALSLRRGLLSLSDANLRLAANVGEHGVNEIFVKEALQDVGVNTKALVKGNLALERQLLKVLKAEGKRLGNAADNNELTKEEIELADRLLTAGIEISDVDQQLIDRNRERLGVSKEQLLLKAEEAALDEEIQTGRKEALIEVQDDIAFAKARGDEQKIIRELIAEELELKAAILETDGDLAGAAKARRKAVLAETRARGTRRGGGGKSKRDKEAEERLKRIHEQDRLLLARLKRLNTLEVALAAQRFEKLQRLDPFSSENVELQLANVIDLGERRARIDLDQRLRAVDELRSQGVDPIQLAQLEADAKIESIRKVAATKDAALQRELDLAILTGSTADAAALRDERRISAAETLNEIEGSLHDLQMTRISERDRAEEESLKKRQEFIKSGSDMWLSAAETVARAVILEGKSLKKAVAGTAKKLALEHAILAGSEALKGVVAAISLNLPKAAAHGISASENAAFAASMGAIAGVAGGTNFATKSVGLGAIGAPGAGGFGDGGAANGPQGGSSGGGVGIGGGVPVSPSSSGLDASGQAASQAGGASVNVTQIIEVNTMGTPSEESMQALAKAQRKAVNRLGRLSVGT